MNLPAELTLIAALLDKQDRPYLADVARLAASALSHAGCCDCGRPLAPRARSVRCGACLRAYRQQYQRGYYLARKGAA